MKCLLKFPDDAKPLGKASLLAPSGKTSINDFCQLEVGLLRSSAWSTAEAIMALLGEDFFSEALRNQRLESIKGGTTGRQPSRRVPGISDCLPHH